MRKIYLLDDLKMVERYLIAVNGDRFTGQKSIDIDSGRVWHISPLC